MNNLENISCFKLTYVSTWYIVWRVGLVIKHEKYFFLIIYFNYNNIFLYFHYYF